MAIFSENKVFLFIDCQSKMVPILCNVSFVTFLCPGNHFYGFHIIFSSFLDCSILWFGFASRHKTDFFGLWNEKRGQSVVYDFFPFLCSRHWENVNKTAKTNLTKSSPCYYFNTSPPEKDNYWSVVSGRHCLLARRNNSENTKARLNAYVWPHFYTTYKSKLEIIRVP